MNISEMTNEQLNEALAIEVMGWILDSSVTTGRLGLAWYCNEEMDDVIAVKNWNPAEDLNQAVECAEKMYPELEIQLGRIGLKGYEVFFMWFDESIHDGYYAVIPSPARAISEAVLMARRGEK